MSELEITIEPYDVADLQPLQAELAAFEAYDEANLTGIRTLRVFLENSAVVLQSLLKKLDLLYQPGRIKEIVITSGTKSVRVGEADRESLKDIEALAVSILARLDGQD